MTEINLDPHVGEEVFVQGQSGRFRITRVDPCTDNPELTRFYGSIDLEELRSGFPLRNIPAGAIRFDEERPVYRTIESLRENPETAFPKDIVDYNVEIGEDHYGTPAFFVRFFVDPDDQPSPEKIKYLNRFRGIVQAALSGLSLSRQPFVLFKEKRSLLDVAS